LFFKIQTASLSKWVRSLSKQSENIKYPYLPIKNIKYPCTD
jgi:hypothetical protein